MVTIAHFVEKIIRKKPFLEEALSRGIINYAGLAEEMEPEIKKELGKKANLPSIVMALRRLSEKLEKAPVNKYDIKLRNSDITIKSDLVEINFEKSKTLVEKIRKLYEYDIVDIPKGDYLAVTNGEYETAVIFNKKHETKLMKLFGNEKIIKKINNLSSLTIRLPKDSLETVGIFYSVTKELTWENINIFEIISTLTEMTFIIKDKDVGRAFETVKELISN